MKKYYRKMVYRLLIISFVHGPLGPGTRARGSMAPDSWGRHHGTMGSGPSDHVTRTMGTGQWDRGHGTRTLGPVPWSHEFGAAKLFMLPVRNVLHKGYIMDLLFVFPQTLGIISVAC